MTSKLLRPRPRAADFDSRHSRSCKQLPPCASLGMSGHLEVWKSGLLKVWKSDHLEVWKSVNLEVWKSGQLEAWKSGHLEVWESQCVRRAAVPFQRCWFCKSALRAVAGQMAWWPVGPGVDLERDELLGRFGLDELSLQTAVAQRAIRHGAGAVSESEPASGDS
jgi:hypothetical protein